MAHTKQASPLKTERRRGRDSGTPGPQDAPSAEMPEAGLSDQHPLASLAGKYKDVSWWDDYLAAIEEYRREVDAKDPLG